jgi:hypothetical protein
VRRRHFLGAGSGQPLRTARPLRRDTKSNQIKTNITKSLIDLINHQISKHIIIGSQYLM